MFKNVASQKIVVLALDTSTGAPKTGDAANLTVYVAKDDGAVTALGDTSASELDATNAPGLYTFDVTQAETNADKLVFSGKSSTANIRVRPEIIFTRPPNFGALSITGGGVSVATDGISDASFAAGTGKKVIRAGTAQGGAAGSITLDAGASAVANFYRNRLIRTTGGVGAGQSAFCYAYDGTTKVALVDPPWVTVPDATTTFAVRDEIPMWHLTRSVWALLNSFGEVTTAAALVDLVFDEDLTTHNNANTLGVGVRKVIGNIDGNVLGSVLGDTVVGSVQAVAAQAIADALLDRAAAIEGRTPREILRAVIRVLLALTSGATSSGGIVKVRDLANTKDAITITGDQHGNRSASSVNDWS